MTALPDLLHQTAVSMVLSWRGKPKSGEKRIIYFYLFITQSPNALFPQSPSLVVLFCFHPLCVFVVGNHDLDLADGFRFH